MIGHYLLTLNVEAESEILTSKMRRVGFNRGGYKCLVGAAAGMSEDLFTPPMRPQFYRTGVIGHCGSGVDCQYDDLCFRFGERRVNAAIRNRILSNRANRVLRHAPQLEAV